MCNVFAHVHSCWLVHKRVGSDRFKFSILLFLIFSYHLFIVFTYLNNFSMMYRQAKFFFKFYYFDSILTEFCINGAGHVNSLLPNSLKPYQNYINFVVVARRDRHWFDDMRKKMLHFLVLHAFWCSVIVIVVSDVNIFIEIIVI